MARKDQLGDAETQRERLWDGVRRLISLCSPVSCKLCRAASTRQWSLVGPLLFAFLVSQCPRAESFTLQPGTGPAIGLTRVEVKPNVYLVVGGGSNSAFLVTDAGVVLIGAKESEQAGQELREVIAGVTSLPVRYLILPNHQARSTRGATAFPQAVSIVAHEQARRYMEMPPQDEYWTGPAAASMPDFTLSQRLTLYLGSTRVQILHPGRGHTDADLMVMLPDQRVAFTGDLFWNRRLPFVDRQHGGSASGLLATMQRLLAMPGMETLIPGYGDVGTRADLRAQYTLLRELQGKVRNAIARGRTRAQTIQDLPIPEILRSDPLERYEALLGAMYDELSRRPPRPPARAPARKPEANQ